MPSLSKKDRVSLCSFTFSDGRRCRTPRVAKHPHFCFYHAQKEARARAAKKLGKDLAYFFSSDYVSGCDLSTALARLIPAVVRGDVKPRTARTVAYLAQTLMQAIHIGQHEYINAFGSDGWRKSIRNSVNGNHDYRYPPAPQPNQSAPSAPPTNPPAESPQPQQPGSSSRPPMPPTGAEFVQHVVAALQNGTPPPQPASSSPAPMPPTSAEFVHVVAGLQTRTSSPQLASCSPSSPPAESPQPQPAAQPVEMAANCHSERSAHSASRTVLRDEEPAFSSSPAPPPATAPQSPPANTAPTHPACHPEHNEGSQPIPAAPAAPPTTPPPTPPPTPNRNTSPFHFDHNYRLLIDGKPF